MLNSLFIFLVLTLLIQQRSPHSRRSFSASSSKGDFLLPLLQLKPECQWCLVFKFYRRGHLPMMVCHRGWAPYCAFFFFLPRLSSSLIFYRGYAPHWFFTEVMLLIDFLPRLCSSLIFYRGYAPHWFFMPCEEGFLQIEPVSKWNFN
jgi:hypothetical protein